MCVCCIKSATTTTKSMILSDMKMNVRLTSTQANWPVAATGLFTLYTLPNCKVKWSNFSLLFLFFAVFQACSRFSYLGNLCLCFLILSVLDCGYTTTKTTTTTTTNDNGWQNNFQHIFTKLNNAKKRKSNMETRRARKDGRKSSEWRNYSNG